MPDPGLSIEDRAYRVAMQVQAFIDPELLHLFQNDVRASLALANHLTKPQTVTDRICDIAERCACSEFTPQMQEAFRAYVLSVVTAIQKPENGQQRTGPEWQLRAALNQALWIAKNDALPLEERKVRIRGVLKSHLQIKP